MGDNYYGQLGIGTNDPGTDKDAPTLVDGPLPGGSITRIAGADRFATAIAVSKANFTPADAVIIATGMNYADVLSASALAGSEKAPLLLTKPDVLSPGVLTEIERLGAKKAYIMGSTAAASDAVEGSLASAGLSVERIQGADRYGASAAIAAKVAALENASFAKLRRHSWPAATTLRTALRSRLWPTATRPWSSLPVRPPFLRSRRTGSSTCRVRTEAPSRTSRSMGEIMWSPTTS
ncbi:MAG: cell wall-binding repeat-containing protein [Coriobacteriia bacterium]|nr:cell wall-binding repeat-containing protein [Coriobacteriia bacterium]